MNDLDLLFSLTPSLIHLKIISLHNWETSDVVFNGAVWENIIKTKLSLLKQFQIFFTTKFYSDLSTFTLESIMTPFQTTFWLNKKHWNFCADCDIENRTIRLYTIPICRTIHDKDIYVRCSLSSKNNMYSIIHRTEYCTDDSNNSHVCWKCFTYIYKKCCSLMFHVYYWKDEIAE